MTIRERFKDAVTKGIIRRKIEPGPIEDAPALSDHDVARIRSEHVRRLCGDIEFYGPGASEAYARRDAALARREARIARSGRPAMTSSPNSAASSPKKKTKISKRARLERKAEKLRAEIARLRGKK